MLLRILPNISSSQLSSILAEKSQSLGDQHHRSRSVQDTDTGDSSYPFGKKGGLEYWTAHPLDSVENIRRWQWDHFESGDIPQEQKSPEERNQDFGHDSRQADWNDIEPSANALIGEIEHQSRSYARPALEGTTSGIKRFEAPMAAVSHERSSFDRQILPNHPKELMASTEVRDLARDREAASIRQPMVPNLQDRSVVPTNTILPVGFQREFIW